MDWRSPSTPLFVSILHGDEWRRRRAAYGTELRSLGLDEVTTELDCLIVFGRSCVKAMARSELTFLLRPAKQMWRTRWSPVSS